MTTPSKSSFIQRKMSKEDTIIQIFRPLLSGRVGQSLDVLDRIVSEAESLTKLGVMLQPGVSGGEKYFCTPADLEANLDEFGELVQIAEKGREFLKALGYVSPRKSTPILQNVPVGKTFEVVPIDVQHPGQSVLSGGIVRPVGPFQPPADLPAGTEPNDKKKK